MSKTSNKQRYTQTMEWVSSMNIQRKRRTKQSKLSKADVYKQR